MLRGVPSARQGRAGRAAGLVRRSQDAVWRWSVALFVCLAWAAHARAAEPFPPGEASEHFDVQARAGKKDILATLQADSRFQVVARAIDAAGLVPLLRTRGPLTVFVPTDAAFEKLPSGRLDLWLKQPKVLKDVLRYHILRAYVPSKQLSRLRNALTALGALLTVDGTSGIKLNGASVISPDLYASNGVIHVVDTVLLPPEAKASKPKRGDKGKGAAQKKAESSVEEDSDAKQ